MSQPMCYYCPLCDRQMGVDPRGNSLNLQSMMQQRNDLSRDGMMYRCTGMSHTMDYQQLMALKPRMQRLVIHEKQPPNTITQTIWVYPEPWAILTRKFPNNLMTTLCALLTALADGDTFIVEGQCARELLELGVDRGTGVVGLAKRVLLAESQVKEMEERTRQHDERIKQGGTGGGRSQIAIPGLTPEAIAAIAAIVAAQSGQAIPATSSPQIDPNDPDAVGKREQWLAEQEEYAGRAEEAEDAQYQTPGAFPSAGGTATTGLASRLGMPRLGGNGPAVPGGDI